MIALHELQAVRGMVPLTKRAECGEVIGLRARPWPLFLACYRTLAGRMLPWGGTIRWELPNSVMTRAVWLAHADRLLGAVDPSWALDFYGAACGLRPAEFRARRDAVVAKLAVGTAEAGRTLAWARTVVNPPGLWLVDLPPTQPVTATTLAALRSLLARAALGEITVILPATLPAELAVRFDQYWVLETTALTEEVARGAAKRGRASRPASAPAWAALMSLAVSRVGKAPGVLGMVVLLALSQMTIFWGLHGLAGGGTGKDPAEVALLTARAMTVFAGLLATTWGAVGLTGPFPSHEALALYEDTALGRWGLSLTTTLMAGLVAVAAAIAVMPVTLMAWRSQAMSAGALLQLASIPVAAGTTAGFFASLALCWPWRGRWLFPVMGVCTGGLWALANAMGALF